MTSGVAAVFPLGVAFAPDHRAAAELAAEPASVSFNHLQVAMMAFSLLKPKPGALIEQQH